VKVFGDIFCAAAAFKGKVVWEGEYGEEFNSRSHIYTTHLFLHHK
jgi:hypothetical protein